MNMTAVAIVAIICWAIVKLAGPRKEGKKSKNDAVTEQENAELRARMGMMQERIEILEKIVTDEKYSLHREFENLQRDNNRAA